MIDRILFLKIICAILQFAGLILFGSTKFIASELVSMAWALVAVAGFASIVQVFIDERHTSMREGFIGAGFIVVALQELFLLH